MDAVVFGAGLGIDAGVERALELTGIVAFAISGGLLATRKGFDLVGVLVLSVVTALGGGVIRDLLLGATPPAAVTDEWYLTLSCATGLVMMVAHRWHHPVRRVVLVFDAAGLGLFCVTGTLKAIEFGVVGPGTVAIGVITATGGGVIRDVLAGEQPQMFRADSVLYSIPAALGAGAIFAASEADEYSAGVGVAVATAVFALRIAALKFGWRAPRPRPAED